MASKAEKKLAADLLTRRRACAERDVVEKFIAEYTYERDCCQVAVRLEALNKCNELFLNVQNDIELGDHEERFEGHLEFRADFEDRFCRAKGFLLSKLESREHPLSSTIMHASSSHNMSASFHHRLPKIDLPKFSGDESRWISFRDNFISMIHCNEDIPIVNKLQYLLQSLEGEAKKPFESVDIQADNYSSTWDALKKRYDNKRFLRKELFRGLYNLPSIKRESAQDLNTLVDDFQRHVKALGKLGEPVEHWDTPLIFILSNKLDAATIRAWEQDTRQKDEVKYDELIDFLIQHVRMLKSVASDLQHRSTVLTVSRVAGQTPKKPSAIKSVVNAATSESQSSTQQCHCCSKTHPLHQCPAFKKLSISQRRELVTRHSLCRNCFRSNHQARACKSKFVCRNCQAKHHTMLHDQPAPQPTSAIQGTSGSLSPPAINLSVHSNSTVLLETVALLVVDRYGRQIPARALLDSAAMSNFITKKLANELATRQSPVDISVAGIGESVKRIKHQLTAKIVSRNSDFSTTLDFLVMRKPTSNLPTIPIDTSTWNIPEVPLADVHFNVPATIDIIIGGECYHELHTGVRQSLGNGFPFLVDTHFGWTVSGKVTTGSTTAPRTCYISAVDQNLDCTLERFWELDTVDEGQNLSAEERKCEEIFASTTTRNHDGRYVVRLPRTDDSQITLGDSRMIAIRRFYSLERRLQRDDSTKMAYHKFIEEYAQLEHMFKIDPVVDNKPHCYLPHHPVFKEASTTTKVRVVFDASCKTTSGYSLNDMLLVGPVVQQDLLSITLRFRTKAIALVADIEKMYRQVNLHPDDQPFHRILWRENPSEPLDTYELRTVTYGTASAPYLATRVLKQLAIDEGDRFPVAAEAIDDYYMDDLLSGANDLESAIQKRRQMSAMCQSAGFQLRKWASNNRSALVDVPSADLAIDPLHDLNEDQSVSTLGLVWDTRTDMLRFNINLPLPASVLTKRKVISYIARIFDPLGLVGPAITLAKLFMQQLWRLRSEKDEPYDWDRPLPSKLQEEWKQFHATLYILADIRIPRFVNGYADCSIQLHFFCDASEAAYGSCCFVRSEFAGEIRVRLLTSKSKVAPLAKKHSIARLELCAAVLSTKLFRKVQGAIGSSEHVYFWSDSTTVLQWLRSPPHRWRTFVANRVTAIQTGTEGFNWRHVPGVQNPADELSRGLQPSDLLNQARWWNGPDWLSSSSEYWPRCVLPENDSPEVAEESPSVSLAATVSEKEDFADQLFTRYSTFKRLNRVTAACIKYIKALQAAAIRRKNQLVTPFPTPNELAIVYLSAEDLAEADRALLRLAQSQLYAEELSEFQNPKRTRNPLSSQLRYLRPFLCDDGIIRVGGRLRNADVAQSVKHPAVLSAKHPLARLITEHYHRTLLHAGPQLMIATIRQRYWIHGGRNLARQTYHGCMKCFRQKPTLVEQSSADLPKSRVIQDRPFAVCGVDYFGPIFIKSPIRRHGPTKAYGAIFVCFVTKAVHIELVSDLSTPAFLSALRRFVARRSRPREIHSDNGTAFKGASNALHRLYDMLKKNSEDREQIFNWCATERIQWKFIPPRAPHFGGLWEAAVKSAKHHILREIGHTNMSYEDMTTLLAEVEMCLNSRPITPIPTETDDLEVLTPGHFLVGTNLQAVDDVDVTAKPDNHLDHWKLTTKRMQGIWARWYPEYLAQLQTRARKGSKSAVPVEVGKIVVIKEDNLPPALWPLGRITKLHPGRDGVVRVVGLKTAKRDDVVRAVNRIAILPTASIQDVDPTTTED
ncbi:uncharacterized protein LOC129737541 [Uranotaenia lowii]|uniref:uncharacterized protein LOC129737541 n=1 Tax=Uranotaenia lowii TaxID=190385 RepID=UPI00247B08C8|nr:uncharacterized protein LOC129737541 [Uranotaenia lowii]